jgi:hypothetical protein
MRVAPALAHDETVAVVPFQSESQQAAGGKNTARLLQNRKEIGDIDHRVGGEDEICVGVGRRPQALQHIGHFKLGIKTRSARLFDHGRRKVDAGEMIDHFGKRGRR